METEGSLFKVPITTIRSIRPHPNPDVTSLEIATIYGFDVVVRKNVYHPGQIVCYCPVDAIFSEEIERLCFPPTVKIKLNNHRLRQTRIQKFPSQGLIIGPDVLTQFGLNEDTIKLEMDVAPILGITKYVPPSRIPKETTGPKLRDKPKENSNFHKFNGITNLKWEPDYFEGKEVIVQLKLHGACCRAGYLPTTANTLWRKIKRFLGLLPKYEYVWGSNNVQLHQRGNYSGYYGSDIYKEVLDRVDAFSKIQPGETIFGELIGEGVQKNYHYGHKVHHFVLFDVKKLQPDGSQVWLDPEEVEQYAKDRGFDFVPVLYRGIWNREEIDKHVSGPDPYYPKHPVREGVVVKLRKNYSNEGNKEARKIISPLYLDNKDNTDYQ